MTGPKVKSSRSWRQFKETMSLAYLAVRPGRSRPDLVYNMLGTHNNLAEQSLFLNLGYWERAKTYDEACCALADELAKEAGLKDGQKLLDAGCGFGDASHFWGGRYKLPRIKALNITRSQVEIARERFGKDAIDFIEGSAMNMPFPEQEFDALFALESSFHFPDRMQFFREAMRVLKPGGVLAIADFFPISQKISLSQRIKEWIGRGLWQIPKANWIDLKVVQKQLIAAGFELRSLRDISPNVFRPYKDYAQRRVKDPIVAERLHPLLAKSWGGPHSGLERSQYVILVLTKKSCL